MWFKKILLTVGIFTIITVNAQDNGIISQPGNVTSGNASTPSISSDNVSDTSTVAPPSNLLPIYSMQCNISKQNALDLIHYEIIRSPRNSTINPQEVINLLQSKYLIIPQKLVDVNFETVLYAINADIMEFLRNLTSYVPPSKTENLQKIAAAFAIDFNKYRDILMENNDTEMWTLLKAGNYTEESIQSALVILQKSENGILSAVWSFIFHGLQNLSLESVLTKFTDQLDELFETSNITFDEIVRYPTLNESFHNVSQKLIESSRMESYWATAVSANTLVTTRSFAANTAVDVYVKNIENMRIYKASQPTLNKTFSALTVQSQLESFINISDKLLKNPECWYIMDINGTLTPEKSENLTFGENITVIQNTDFVHKLGSPLICNNVLYGLLVWQNETELIFAATFLRGQSETVAPPPVAPPPVAGSGNQNMHNFVLAIGLIILCAIFIL